MTDGSWLEMNVIRSSNKAQTLNIHHLQDVSCCRYQRMRRTNFRVPRKL